MACPRRILPWGYSIIAAQANYSGSGDPWEGDGWTTPVGYYDGGNHGGYQTTDSPSLYGLYDVAGNVWEWCSTKFADYPYDPNDGRENPPATYDELGRIMRGGSAISNSYDLQSAGRVFYLTPNVRFGVSGFRCARSE